MTDFNVILFDGFETLDAFGPAEVVGNMPNDYSIGYYSLNGGIVESRHKTKVYTLPLSEITAASILLIPGGVGTRSLVNNEIFIEQLRELSEKSPYVLSVCTGSALLAKTGLLRGKNATSNKLAFDWVTSINPGVNWLKKARWVKDGKYYTSSGVSAGIDMTLGFISDVHTTKIADAIAKSIEYVWNDNSDDDPFAIA